MFTQESIQRMMARASMCEMCKLRRREFYYDGAYMCPACYRARILGQARTLSNDGRRMIPVVFINCDTAPFMADIMHLLKQLETRGKDMLRQLAGQRVLLAESSRSAPPVVRCAVTIGHARTITSRAEWDALRPLHRVPVGNPYDWTPATKVKHAYPLKDLTPIETPFIPPEDVRHGHVWMEYHPDENFLL